MNKNFGKYDLPPTLQKLLSLQNTLGDSEHFYLGLNFYLTLEKFRYFNTPCDVAVFGNIGMDGIHFGFLTDFGSVPSLEEAPIVCVSPMDFDRPVRIVANNLREFLSVNMDNGELFYNHFTSEEAYLAAKKEWEEEAASSPYQPTQQEKEIKEQIKDFIIRNIGLPQIDHPYQYIEHARLERQRKITIPTQDGLGVTAPLLQHEKHVPFPIDNNSFPDPAQVQEYLSTAPVASRLALIRDLQMNIVLQDYPALLNTVIRTLDKMGLHDVAVRLAEDF